MCDDNFRTGTRTPATQNVIVRYETFTSSLICNLVDILGRLKAHTFMQNVPNVFLFVEGILFNYYYSHWGLFFTFIFILACGQEKKDFLKIKKLRGII